MRRFHCSALVAAAVFGFASIASAADLPTKAPVYVAAPIFSWTGLYVGGNVGGHWGTDSITSTTDPVGWTFGGAGSVDSVSPTRLHPNGFIGGLQAGYNWQFANAWVAGIEADVNWLGGSATRTLIGIPIVATGDFMTNETKSTFLATLRPRVGVTFDRALLYVTGGLAIGTLKTTDTFAAFSGTVPATISSSTTRTGWTVGGGLEYAFTRNWSAKVEYLYVDLGSFDNVIPSCTGCAAGSDITVHHKYTDNIARLGVNYKY